MSGYRSTIATPDQMPAGGNFVPGKAHVGAAVDGDAWQVTAIPAAGNSPVTAVPAEDWDWPESDGYRNNAHPPGPFPPAPYQTGPYQTGPYQTGQYKTGPYPAGPYQPSAYRPDAAWQPTRQRPPRRRFLRGFVLVSALLIIAPLTGLAILVAILQTRPLPEASRQAAGTAPTVVGAPRPATPALPSQAGLDAAAITAAVQPAIVDVNSTLGFRNAQAAGTGVVLDASGIVITNNHVIAGATAVSVTEVGTGRTHQATVLGYDRTRDIAVLQLSNAGGLRQMSIADSSRVSVGDAVVAIGNAGGTGGAPATVTGSVTGLNRSITATDADGGAAERLTGLIEVDADIQPGDSGGPLLDRTGRLIGINTATTVGPNAQAGTHQGYAIPGNAALAIARQIQSGQASGTVHIGQTALLGVQSTQNGAQNGVSVAGVVDGSPAQRAGLAPGDLIISLDGRAVDQATALTDLVDSHHPGDRIRMQWIDGGGRGRTAIVELGTGPAG